LVAVGGYGRAELSPFSDVDVVLLHSDQLDASEVDRVAEQLWRGLWEQKVPIDQSVRSLTQMVTLAEADFRVATGLLDARAVAGDAGLVIALRSTVLAHWRRDAKKQLAAIRADRELRLERSGWLAYEAVPDLKNSGGGLRDAVLLRAISATWLVDLPMDTVRELTGELLDFRDELHEAAGRRGDKMLPEYVRDSQADIRVRDIGRRIFHLVERAWHRLAVLERDPHRRVSSAGPKIERLGEGVGALDGEVVLLADATISLELLFRLATAAARRELPINEASLNRLVRDLKPAEFNASTNRALVDLLTVGRSLVPVWLQLDFAGLIDVFLPEWARIRLRGSASPVHRFTIDRHSLEACVNAAELNRGVERPDLLAVAAILHDIGKGRPGDHSEVGAPLAEQVALRWGFGADDAITIGFLVRQHLLLPTVATGRDIEDPVTAAKVAQLVGSTSRLALLSALTASDAQATSPTAWTGWRRALIDGLVAKVNAQLSGKNPEITDYEGWPAAVPRPNGDLPKSGGFYVEVEPQHDGSLLKIVAPDRRGLLADLAGGLTVAGLSIRSCRSVTIDHAATSLWEVTRPGVDAAAVTERLRRVFDGSLNLADRLKYRVAPDAQQPHVIVLEAMEQTATLVQVRALDGRGLVWTVCHAIAEQGLHIRSAHLSTYGDEVRDVFYVTDENQQALSVETTERLRLAVSQQLT